MRLRSITIILASVIGLMPATQAEETSAVAVRREFLQAYLQAYKSDSSSSATDSNTLRSYLLYPYLQRARILQQLSKPSGDSKSQAVVDQATATFLKAHEAEPIARTLRSQWYASLAQRAQWQMLVDHYRDTGDAAMRCHWLSALLATQHLDSLATKVVAAWSSASNSLPACESVFDWLKTQPAWTPQLAETRIRLALNAGNSNFARQLFVLLPSESVSQYERWAQAIDNPRKAIDHAIANPKQSIEPSALLNAWIKLSRNDISAAQARYLPLVHAQLSDGDARRYALELALAMSWNRHPQTLDYFARIKPADLDERGWEWYARAAIWMGRWQRAHQVIEAMPAALQQQTRWRYWLARAEEKLGNTRESQKLFSSLLNDDNYYAALTAARLRQSYAPNPVGIEANEQQLAKIAALPATERAYELWLIDLHDEANDEWRSAYRQLSKDEQVQAIVLAARWGWYEQAILTAADQKLFGDYQLLYPLPFDSQVQSASTLTQLPMELIYATLRQESLYRRDALSAAEAKGLMQLQSSTARNTARRWHWQAPGDLFQPDINIPLGAAYLRNLIDRFDGQYAAGLAAYNAGPASAERWLPTTPTDIDIWIENIPYNETRTYVQRVLWHSVVFGWRMAGKAQNTQHWLARIAKK